jgi:hypothetical protein
VDGTEDGIRWHIIKLKSTASQSMTHKKFRKYVAPSHLHDVVVAMMMLNLRPSQWLQVMYLWIMFLW